MGTKQTIELNGKRYDARTGKLVSVGKSSAQPVQQLRTVNTMMPSTASIDGFSKKRTHPPRRVSQHPAHRSAHKSQTLKRSAVKKPIVPKAEKSSSKATASTSHTPVMEMHSPTYSIPRERLKRLQTIQQSSKITRYPKDLTVPSVTRKATGSSLKVKPNNKDQHVVKAVSTVVDAAGSNQFDQALQNASAHKAPRIKKPTLRARTAKKLRISPRTVNFAGFAFAAMLFAAYFGYSNAPNMSMRLAAMRADVPATIPAYKPSGFSIDRSIQYKQGEITVSFQSNSDNRSFDITQTASGWDSKALHQNFVAKKPHVRTIEDKGKKIYLYDDNNATWVDGGVWYKIEGNSKLGSDQLSRIASSL